MWTSGEKCVRHKKQPVQRSWGSETMSAPSRGSTPADVVNGGEAGLPRRSLSWGVPVETPTRGFHPPDSVCNPIL